MAEIIFPRKNYMSNRSLSSRGGSSTISGTSGKLRRKARKREEGFIPMPRHLNPRNHIQRWMRYQTTISTTAGGIISLFGYDSSQVTSATDWTAISGEFQQYRTKQMRFRAMPATTSATPPVYQSALMLVRFWGLAPTSFTNMASEPSLALKSTLHEFTYEHNSVGFVDADQWTNVGTVIPAEQRFGIIYISPPNPVMIVSSTIYFLLVEWLIEFTGTY